MWSSFWKESKSSLQLYCYVTERQKLFNIIYYGKRNSNNTFIINKKGANVHLRKHQIVETDWWPCKVTEVQPLLGSNMSTCSLASSFLICFYYFVVVDSISCFIKLNILGLVLFFNLVSEILPSGQFLEGRCLTDSHCIQQQNGYSYYFPRIVGNFIFYVCFWSLNNLALFSKQSNWSIPPLAWNLFF